MLKSANNQGRRPRTTRKVAVIKNAHTAAELAESGERWATHEGSYLTLSEVLTIEAEKAKNAPADLSSAQS